MKPLEKLFPERFLLLVTHMISESSVEDYARDRGVALYYSYDFEPAETGPF